MTYSAKRNHPSGGTGGRGPKTKNKAAAPVILFLTLALNTAWGGDTWPAALGRMPLRTAVSELNATNCVALMLRAFGSNATVKALVFLPGATDEFYLVHRARAQLTNNAPTLLDAVAALTNQTQIRATFCSPLLLLHTDADRLLPNVNILRPGTVERLGRARFGQALSIDRDWDYVQPLLRWRLKLGVRPWERSEDSWHFNRLNFSAFGLNGWEALETAALASKTGITLKRNQAVFELDRDTGQTAEPVRNTEAAQWTTDFADNADETELEGAIKTGWRR